MELLITMRSRRTVRDLILAFLALSLATNVTLFWYIQSIQSGFVPLPTRSKLLGDKNVKQNVFNIQGANEGQQQQQQLYKYNYTWESLDARPLPSWYDEAKFGIFIHWGLFTVPAFSQEWFWWKWQGQNDPESVTFMNQHFKKGFRYQDFANQFTAEFFDPHSWTDLFQASGARYVVLTSKHHEGWTNWPSKYSWNWNSVDAGPHRDLVGELAREVRSTDIKFGLYYSLYEWFNPLYIDDKMDDFQSQSYIWRKMMPELLDLITTYEPEILWGDGDWDASSSYWNSTDFLAWLYNESPVKDTVVVNDRWGKDARNVHGDFYTGKTRSIPDVLPNHKWENCMTIDRKSWGYRRQANLEDYMNIDELIRILVETVSGGGNLLMNIGPSADGMIPLIYEERLRQMGNWLKVNGDAIYGSKPWRLRREKTNLNIWYTSKQTGSILVVYAIIIDWPVDGMLYLETPKTSTETTISMLGYETPLSWKPEEPQGLTINMSNIPFYKLPCQWAWTLRMDYVM
ncbi:alpha-L-fucosidase-like [Glandiceps talaboti]